MRYYKHTSDQGEADIEQEYREAIPLLLFFDILPRVLLCRSVLNGVRL
jgi:hypothetical protein